KAGTQIGPADVLGKKACVETISGTHWINRVHLYRRSQVALFAALHHGSHWPKLHHNNGYDFGQALGGKLRVIRAGNLSRLALVGQKHVDIRKYLVEAAPGIRWVIVSIQGGREPCGLYPLEKLHHPGPQSLLQIQRRKMKMSAGTDVVKIDIFESQLRDRPQISQDIAPIASRQDHGHAGCGAVAHASNLRNINSPLTEQL